MLPIEELTLGRKDPDAGAWDREGLRLAVSHRDEEVRHAYPKYRGRRGIACARL